MAATPLVSIGLPIADEPIRFVATAIESVLAQTHSDWELLVACDGAPTQTVEFLQTYDDPRIEVAAHRDRLGLATRLNQFAQLAKGSFLARMDADDVMFSERIERQLRFLETHPEVDLVSSRAVTISVDGAVHGITRRHPAPYSKANFLRSTPFVHPTAFARTDWWTANPYDQRYIRVQDKVLWLQSFDRTVFHQMEDPLLFYRLPTRLDPAKYSRSVGYERRVIRAFGPEAVGRLETAAVLARSLVKQLVVTVAARAGKEGSVLRRRYEPLESGDLLRYQQKLDALVDSANPPTESATMRLDS